jgi:hypothetical protein
MVLSLGQIQNPHRGDGPCPGSMLNITLPDSPGIAVYQDHYGGHNRKENSCTCNTAIEIQTPRRKLFDLRWVQESKGE